jgi:hypothetical protein
MWKSPDFIFNFFSQAYQLEGTGLFGSTGAVVFYAFYPGYFFPIPFWKGVSTAT